MISDRERACDTPRPCPYPDRISHSLSECRRVPHLPLVSNQISIMSLWEAFLYLFNVGTVSGTEEIADREDASENEITKYWQKVNYCRPSRLRQSGFSQIVFAWSNKGKAREEEEWERSPWGFWRPNDNNDETYLRRYGRRIIGADVVTHSAGDSGKEQPRCRENGNESRREDREERERDRTQSNTESALYSYSTHGYKKAASSQMDYCSPLSFAHFLAWAGKDGDAPPTLQCARQGSPFMDTVSCWLDSLLSRQIWLWP